MFPRCSLHYLPPHEARSPSIKLGYELIKYEVNSDISIVDWREIEWRRVLNDLLRRFGWVMDVKLFDEIWSIGQIWCWLPRIFWYRVASSVDFIPQFAIIQFWIKDLFNLPFIFIINDDWKWRLTCSSKDSRRFIGFKERYMEDEVYFHGSWKI